MQLQQDLEYLRSYMHKVFYAILLNSASRDATLKYIAEVLQRNIRRQQMQVNERTVAGDGFMLNLLSVMQHLSAKVSLNQVCPLTQLLEVFFFATHLSKGSSGRKQKCTQFPTPFSGTVFYALSHGVIHFVRSVSFKNLKMEVFDWLLKNFNQQESGFSS